jgi:hypothetical protein
MDEDGANLVNLTNDPAEDLKPGGVSRWFDGCIHVGSPRGL